MILRLYFKLLRCFNKGEPSREEVKWAMYNYNHTARINSVMALYIKGFEINDISYHCQYSRERVRQMIRKGCRQAHDKI